MQDHPGESKLVALVDLAAKLGFTQSGSVKRAAIRLGFEPKQLKKAKNAPYYLTREEGCFSPSALKMKRITSPWPRRIWLS
jgi:hypothetical protein